MIKFRRWLGMSAVLLSVLGFGSSSAWGGAVEVKNLSVNGGIEDGKPRLVIEATLGSLLGDKEKLIYSTSLRHSIRVTRENLDHSIAATFDVLQGEPAELLLTLSGEGEIRQVTGPALQDWSVRQETNGVRTLVLRPRKINPPVRLILVSILAEQPIRDWTQSVSSLALAPVHPALFDGYVKVEATPELHLQPGDLSGLVPIETRFLPAEFRMKGRSDELESLAYRFQGSAYVLPLRMTLADPDARRVVLSDFRLNGSIHGESAAFTLQARARVQHPKGGTLRLLAGGVALTELEANPDWNIQFERGEFVLRLERAGDFPLRLKFNAAVRASNGWNTVDFRIAPSTLQPIVLDGLAADTQFQFMGAARPERTGSEFSSYLPPNGLVKLAWKETPREAEGKLFYAVEALSQIGVSPGLMKQTTHLDFKVMQGELTRVALGLRGPGEVTRVQGDSVLSWDVTPIPNSADRRLTVQLNQPQRERFALQVQTQLPLGVFPQSADALQIRPEGSTRFAGYIRIVNEGAVRLEVTQASGLSQISPEEFPETDATKALLRTAGAQRFVYRFSNADLALRIQADQILPELTVSQVLAYHLAENESSIDAEIELDIREAPLRESILRVPKGYGIARVIVAGLSDYFLREPADLPDAELRLVYGQPVTGRQMVQLRLERNQPLGGTNWSLPRIEVVQAKSVRGHVGVAAESGFRLTAERIQGLSEIATAFFPRKVAGLQIAFRLSDPAWQAAVRVERLPQTVQADVFHLFSIGEGVAYGSSVMNYVVSGAPVSSFRVQLADEYFNVEFTGKDVRNWQKGTNGYVVQLHSPVSGPYTLLAAYERPFKAQGEILGFAGARPLDVQSEQGHTLVVSAYQFQVQPVEVSPGLLPLEPGEVPAEYRLFFDAPVLAAYRYTSRPFNLRLALSPLAQGDSLRQVVDRALLRTRISKEGQILTEVRYFLKNRGAPHFRVALPAGTQLWSATVNGASVVPVTDANDNLIPLPQRVDPNAVLAVELKLAARSTSPARVRVSTPLVGAPVMLAEWKLEPDPGQRLVYRGGSLTPVGGVSDVSGFGGVARAFQGFDADRAWTCLGAAIALGALSLMTWRWTVREGVYKFSLRYWTGALLGLACAVGAVVFYFNLSQLVSRQMGPMPRDLAFLAPVQQVNSILTADVRNMEEGVSFWESLSYLWPAIVGLGLWISVAVAWNSLFKPMGFIVGWTLIAWAALRWPNGGPVFLGIISLFWVVWILIPAWRRLGNLPPKMLATPAFVPGGAAPLGTTLLMGALLGMPGTGLVSVRAAETLAENPPLADSVTQHIRIEDAFALATAKVHWVASKGQMLPLLYEPAVLTGATLPTNALRLVEAPLETKRGRHLLALDNGSFDVTVDYQLPIEKNESDPGITVPIQYGLINELRLTLMNMDVDVFSPQAVSVQRDLVGSNTVASLVLLPVNGARVGWRPRHRDLKQEKAVFYAEIAHLYVPTAGAVEGTHYAVIRPARGELHELLFSVPSGATITDVAEPFARTNSNAQVAGAPMLAGASSVSAWRFDPDAHKLRVTLAPAQSRPFALVIRSQVSTGPLPFTQVLGLVAADNAAGQIGVMGLATGSGVQIDSATASAFTPINIEDFPSAVLESAPTPAAGLTLHRTYRFAELTATAEVKVSALEPDVRVETQDTVSLGEDRTVLAANAVVTIARAGLFRLSFALPPSFDVESISGEALSHWTESRVETNRIITLHFRGKTDGRQQFAISLAGPGVRATNSWTVPQMVFREAAKQRGTMLMVPEQGMRLQVTTRDGVTQLDPQQSGIRQKGVLAFRILQTPWRLVLGVEQVDPWIQVASLQHATINEALVKVAANLQYQIENTGLKALRVLLPANADSVRFQGEHVSDFLPLSGVATNGWQEWEVKLHRRVIGQYLLQVNYQTVLPEMATEFTLRGVQAAGINLQRGYVTAQSGGRLQVRVDSLPATLQPTEWQSIPRALQVGLQAASANFSYRLLEPSFQLVLKLDRHQVAKLLPARVNNINLSSVISDDGVMLTQVRLEMLTGDKRLLHLTLPKDARFWFAFVNQNGVWPWREQDQILIPLEPPSQPGGVVPVEFFFSSSAGATGRHDLDLALVAPKFDLPLENVTWRVYLNEKWQLKHWTGSLQLEEQRVAPSIQAIDLPTYLQNEANAQREKTKEAEKILALGNSALEQGDPQQARRAFQAAYGLTKGDDAFNEDARVQLNNLKLQQALLGLNVRQASLAGESDSATNKLREFRNRRNLNYTQQDAKAILDRNSSEENAAFLRLAQRLVQQQDAAVSSPAAIRASIPEQGQVLTFKRAVVVDTWADLKVDLAARALRSASWGRRTLILAGTFLLLVLLAWGARPFRPILPPV